MLKKSKYTVEDFLQTLSNGKKVLDFSKIKATGFPIRLIMTERGAKGKTLNAKEDLRKDFQKDGSVGIWLTNTEIMSEKQKADFFEDLNKPFVRNELPDIEFWDNCKIKGSLKKNRCYVYYKDQKFIKIQPLSMAEDLKGARLKWSSIKWEEFNVNFNRVLDAVNRLDSLLHSTEDLVSNHGEKQTLMLDIFGNNKSLNNKIIYAMGVTHIENEVTEVFDDNGKKLMLIISPRFTPEQKQEIEEQNKDNWIYQLSKKLGTANHSYFNESLYDDVNNVFQYTKTQESANKYLLPQMTIHHRKQYYNIYKIKIGDRKNKYHIVSVDKKDIFSKAIAVFNKRDMIENAVLNSKYKTALLKLLSHSDITYEDIVSRELFISSLTK